MDQGQQGFGAIRGNGLSRRRTRKKNAPLMGGAFRILGHDASPSKKKHLLGACSQVGYTSWQARLSLWELDPLTMEFNRLIRLCAHPRAIRAVRRTESLLAWNVRLKQEPGIHNRSSIALLKGIDGGIGEHLVGEFDITRDKRYPSQRIENIHAVFAPNVPRVRYVASQGQGPSFVLFRRVGGRGKSSGLACDIGIIVRLQGFLGKCHKLGQDMHWNILS